MKIIIVAYDKNYGIGVNNDLPWQRNLPADLKHFKDITTGNAVIMGSNTYRSIGRPLPNRQNIIISTKKWSVDGAIVVNSLQTAYDSVQDDKDAYIIGGGTIYALALDTVDRILATEINAVFDQSTTFFPAIDSNKWVEISREKHLADEHNLYNYDFVTYKRR